MALSSSIEHAVPKQPNRHSANSWIAKADEDIDTVDLCLSAGGRLANVAAFHTQQAAEKLLKAAPPVVVLDVRTPDDAWSRDLEQRPRPIGGEALAQPLRLALFRRVLEMVLDLERLRFVDRDGMRILTRSGDG